MNEIGKTGSIPSKIGGNATEIGKTAVANAIQGIGGDLGQDMTKKIDAIVQTKFIGGDLKSTALSALAPCITSELAEKRNLSIGLDPRQIANVRGVFQAAQKG